MSGLIADSRTMVDKARVEAQVQRRSLKKYFALLNYFWFLVIKSLNTDDFSKLTLYSVYSDT